MANEQLSMDDILSDAPATTQEPTATAEPGATEAPDKPERSNLESGKRAKHREREALAAGKVRDPDTGQYVSPKDAPEGAIREPQTTKEPEATPEPTAAPPVTTVKPAATQQSFTPQEKAFLAAAQDERRKRQELEGRLAALEAGKQKEEAKPFWDDPEGAMKAHQEQLNKIAFDTKIQTAEMITRSAHPDFDEKVAVFAEIVKLAPHVAAYAVQQPNPAEAVYQIAANHMMVQQAGGVDKLVAEREAKARADERAKVMAEMKAAAEAEAAQRAALPGSLTGAHSTGDVRKTWGGPPSMDEILKG